MVIYFVADNNSCRLIRLLVMLLDLTWEDENETDKDGFVYPANRRIDSTPRNATKG